MAFWKASSPANRLETTSQQSGRVGQALSTLDRLNHDVGGAKGAHHSKSDDREQGRDEADGKVSGPRNGSLGVFGLFAVNRGCFEADERGKGEGERDSSATGKTAREDVGRSKRRGDVETVGAASNKDSHRNDEERSELEDEQHAEHLGANVNTRERKQGDERPGGNRPHPPRQVEAERCHLAGDEATEEAVNGQLNADVGDDRDEGARDAGVSAKAAAYVGEKRSSVGDFLAHRGVTNAEH